jgi:predicted double-glycine peptidase
MCAGYWGVLCAVIALSGVTPLLADTRPRLQPIKQLQMAGIERQTLDYSCGAAALTIMFNRYFGDAVKEQDVLADIVFRLSSEEAQARMVEGFSMLDLKQTAERLGYQAEGLSLGREQVARLRGPVIILLRRKTLNHFVVLKGVGQGKAFLADPARGHVRVPLHELFEEWQGETLTIFRVTSDLPDRHGLNIPRGSGVAPERETVRALQQARY